MKRGHLLTYLLLLILCVTAFQGYHWYRAAQTLEWQKETLYTAWLDEFALTDAITPLHTYLQTSDPRQLEQSLAVLLDQANLASRAFTGYFYDSTTAPLALGTAREAIRAAAMPGVPPEQRSQALQAVVAGLEELKQRLEAERGERDTQFLHPNSRLRQKEGVEAIFAKAATQFDAVRKQLP